MKIAVISLYPPKKSKHAKLGGVASYTKNLVESLSRIKKVRVIIFANKLNNKKEKYTEQKIKIIRCWNRGYFYPYQLLYNSFKYRNDIDLIHIQHEYFLYGGVLSSIMFPIMIFLMKLFLRKKIIVTIHGVIPLSEIDDTFMQATNIRGNKYLFKFGMFILTKIISIFPIKIIVHELYFKDILNTQYNINPKKIEVIPHGVENVKLLRKDNAKQDLGLKNKKILMYFGYITGYKGIEFLIESFKYIKNKDFILIIAGGEHPRLKNKLGYQKYIKDLKDSAIYSERIIFTGFVPEDKISLYFSATDLVVLPYTTFISSSGPMNLTIAYEKPFLVSDVFRDIAAIHEMVFERDPKALAAKIEKIFDDERMRQKFLKHVRILKKQHGWAEIIKKYLEVYMSVLKK